MLQNVRTYTGPPHAPPCSLRYCSVVIMCGGAYYGFIIASIGQASRGADVRDAGRGADVAVFAADRDKLGHEREAVPREARLGLLVPRTARGALQSTAGPHLRRDWAHPYHIRLRRDWAHPYRIGAGTAYLGQREVPNRALRIQLQLRQSMCQCAVACGMMRVVCCL